MCAVNGRFPDNLSTSLTYPVYYNPTSTTGPIHHGQTPVRTEGTSKSERRNQRHLSELAVVRANLPPMENRFDDIINIMNNKPQMSLNTDHHQEHQIILVFGMRNHA